ncbi:MAG: hypothetical protein WC412_05845 [Candidatus Omnitrophota bacterium]|jgi:hypothetical protein
MIVRIDFERSEKSYLGISAVSPKCRWKKMGKLIGKQIFVSINILLGIFGVILSALFHLDSHPIVGITYIIIFSLFMYYSYKLSQLDNYSRKIMLPFIMIVMIVLAFLNINSTVFGVSTLRSPNRNMIIFQYKLKIIMPFILYGLVFIYYFTRSRIKKQFK